MGIYLEIGVSDISVHSTSRKNWENFEGRQRFCGSRRDSFILHRHCQINKKLRNFESNGRSSS